MAEISQTEATADVSSQANAPKDRRPLYEIGFHLVPTIEEGKIGEVVDALKAEVKKAGGEIVAEQAPAKMTLSYIIERAVAGKREKYAETYFGWLKFVVEEKAGITALESHLQHNKNILRYLFVETVREEVATRRAVFSSNRLEGETIKKPSATPEEPTGEVSDEELNKSLDAIVS